MQFDNEIMEILMRYAREVQSESTINDAEYEPVDLELMRCLLAAIG